MVNYQVEVRRGDVHWLVEIPGIGRTTQARRIRDVEPMARDLISVMEDIDGADVELEVTYHLPEAVAEHWQRSAELHATSADLRREATAEAGRAAHALRDLGLTVRDIGTLLHISHQRADQLLRR